MCECNEMGAKNCVRKKKYIPSIFILSCLRHCAVLSAVVTWIIIPELFMSFVFCAWVFLNFLSKQTFLIYLSYISLIILVCTLVMCKVVYFSCFVHFVSDDLLLQFSFWPMLRHAFHSFHKIISALW